MGHRIPNGRLPARAARQLPVATPGARSSRQATEKGPLRAGKRLRNWGRGVATKHSARLAKCPAQSRSERLKPQPSARTAGTRPQTSLSRSFPNPGAALQKQNPAVRSFANGGSLFRVPRRECKHLPYLRGRPMPLPMPLETNTTA